MKFKAGDRIRLVEMGEDPDPIPSGMEGTVTHCTDLKFVGEPELQVGVKWDNGRSLSCIVPPDVLVLADTNGP